MKAEKEGIEDINVRGELVEAYLRRK